MCFFGIFNIFYIYLKCGEKHFIFDSYSVKYCEIQFKMESIFKMAILRLSIRPSEPCIFAIFKPTIFKFWIHIDDYLRINDTFFDSLFIISEIKLGLGPVFFIIFHDFLRIFPIPLECRVDPMIYFGSSNLQ
jgi:hypothetical protein